MNRPRGVLAVTVSTLLLLLVGLAPAGATIATDPPPDAVPTTVEVVATASGPLQMHLDITLRSDQGTPGDGYVRVQGAHGEGSTYLTSGAEVGVDLSMVAPGDQDITVEYLGSGRFLPSSTTVPVTVEALPTTLVLTVEDQGVGVLGLRADLGTWDNNGVVVFEVDGLAPVTVPLGRWVIPGRLDLPAARPDYAGVAFEGLDPKGTYHATATFIPGEGSRYAGSAAETTTTLSWTDNYSLVIAKPTSPRAGVVKLVISVLAYFPADASGTLRIADVTTGKNVVVRGVTPYPNLTHKTLVGLAPGRHRFHISFVPAPGVKLLGSDVWRTVTVLR